MCDLSRPSFFLLLSDFGRPRRAKTAPLASDGAAQLHERRAGELKRPEVERLESPVGETGEVSPVDALVATPAQRMSHFFGASPGVGFTCNNPRHVVRSDSPVVCQFFT